jgi:hypothetical protein
VIAHRPVRGQSSVDVAGGVVVEEIVEQQGRGLSCHSVNFNTSFSLIKTSLAVLLKIKYSYDVF